MDDPKCQGLSSDSKLFSLSTGFAYFHPLVYRAFMWGLYRNHYRARLEEVARLVPDGASVVDLCCGDGSLGVLLQQKNCEYQGLDIQPQFLHAVRKKKLRAHFWDGDPEAIPEADVVCMASSLYQFIPQEGCMVACMVARARRLVLIAEPIQNLASSGNSWLREVAISANRVGKKKFYSRFSEKELRKLCSVYGAEFSMIAGGRELLACIRK